LTSIKLLLNGAHAWATVDGPLTSGMVGIPVTIEYDESWDGLTKNLMCRCSPWGSNNGEIRSILDVGETATVAHEVMQPDMFLHLGIEGFNEDGTLVIPTTWARCGKIEYGANTCEDPSTNPELSVWNQLQVEMEKTKAYVLTPEQAVNIQSYAQTATQAAQEARQAAEEAKQTVGSGLYYIPSVSQPTDTTLKFEFKPSVTGVPVPKPVTVTLPVGEGSGENVTQGGLSAAAKAALMAVVESIAVFTVDNPQELIANLRNAMYDAPVASISAVYTQTRTVYASDALDVLRDDIDRSIDKNAALWAESYACRPSQFFLTETDLLAEDFRALIDEERGVIEASQLPDGSWSIPWGWGMYPKEWALSECWWKADMIIRYLRVLRMPDLT